MHLQKFVQLLGCISFDPPFLFCSIFRIILADRLLLRFRFTMKFRLPFLCHRLSPYQKWVCVTLSKNWTFCKTYVYMQISVQPIPQIADNTFFQFSPTFWRTFVVRIAYRLRRDAKLPTPEPHRQIRDPPPSPDRKSFSSRSDIDCESRHADKTFLDSAPTSVFRHNSKLRLSSAVF